MTYGRKGFGMIAAALTAVLALPAVAQASRDLAVSQTASASLVKPGERVTITATVSNQGTEAEDAFVSISSLRSQARAANNPYQSFSSSQGACVDESGVAYGMLYHFLTCTLGTLAPGATAQVIANVIVNDSAVHSVALLPNAYEGGYTDGDNSNNGAFNRITVSIPPTLSGSKKIKLLGLPQGCVPGDFTLTVVPKVTRVKKVAAYMFLGFNEDGEGESWDRSAKKARLRVKVPASRIIYELNKTYELKIKVRRKGGGAPLKLIVTFELC